MDISTLEARNEPALVPPRPRAGIRRPAGTCWKRSFQQLNEALENEAWEMDWWPPLTCVLADDRQYWQDDLPRPVAQAALASLSADPEQLDDFPPAARRYLIGQTWPWPAPAGYSEPTELLEPLTADPDSDFLLIHLPTRVIATTHPDRFPLCSTIPLIRDHVPTSQSLLYVLRSDWQIVLPEKALALWADPDFRQSAAGRIDRAAESRRVLYDEVIPWIIAQRAAGRSCSSRQLHGQWLVTPRLDLEQRSPREVLFEHFSFIDRDLDYQQHNWVVTRTRPPALADHSAAFRAAPFGRVELTMYHLLVRHLIDAHDRSFSRAAATSDQREITRRIERLRREKERWWTAPLAEYEGDVPREMAECERRRIPWTMDPEKMANCECPICRALADQGPTFVIFDCPPLGDDDFVFSYYRTKQEWEESRVGCSDDR